MLVPAIARITARFGEAPRAVTADRGYGEAKVDAELEALGVKRVAIPRRGKPGAARQKVQRGAAFTKLVKWRTGSEARISSSSATTGGGTFEVDGIGGTAGVVRVGRARPQRHQGQRPPPRRHRRAGTRLCRDGEAPDRPGNRPITKTCPMHPQPELPPACRFSPHAPTVPERTGRAAEIEAWGRDRGCQALFMPKSL